MLKKYLAVIFLFFTLIATVSTVVAQITFNHAPSRLQLFPRNTNDSADVQIDGQVNLAQYSKIIFTYYKDNVVNDSTVIDLNFSGGTSLFSKTYKIKARKSLYSFRVFLYDNTTAIRVMTADSVVCGDVYLVDGQSNATATAIGGSTEPAYLWIRSFGTPSATAALAQADTTWGLAITGNANTPYSIGIWGMRMARMLIDTLSVPICIINGAKSGAAISFHLPSSNPLNLSSIYGRILYRAQKAVADQFVKAMFWFQGESDGGVADAPVYPSRFATIYNAWSVDFPALQKIFVVQTRHGCIDGSPQHSQVRESLRKLAYNYPKVVTLSSFNLPNFDGCHYDVPGYISLAGYLYRQVSRDLYGKTQPITANPPDIVAASYTNADNSELSLVFNQAILWPANLNGYDLKDYFYFNAPVTVLSGVAINNTIKLTLSGASNATIVTYLPNQYYNATNVNYNGPWLTNADGLGAFSFFELPITSGFIISGNNTAICPNIPVNISSNGTGSNYQWYYNGNAIFNANTNNYDVTQPGQYLLKMTNNINIVLTSNTLEIESNQGENPVITSAGNMFEFCQGSTLSLSTTQSYPYYLWSNGQSSSNINVTVAGSYSVRVTNAAGCSSVSATVNINSIYCPVLNLKVYFDGNYENGNIRAVLNSIGAPTIFDTVSVSLANSSSPFSKVQTIKSIVSTSGEGTFSFHNLNPGNYFIVVRYRNAIETWSKYPVSFYDASITYDFTR